jgi:hypothetical protein
VRYNLPLHVMSGQLSLLGKPTLTIERNEGAKLVAHLSIAGLIAGLITVSLVYPAGRLSIRHPHSAQYIVGAALGITLAVSLAARGLLRGFGGFCKAISLVMLSTLAYFVAFWVAGGLELVFFNSERPPLDYPLAMFAGGFAGGFLVLGGDFCWSIRSGYPEPLGTRFCFLLSSAAF